jgi:hypothetical protein
LTAATPIFNGSISHSVKSRRTLAHDGFPSIRRLITIVKAFFRLLPAQSLRDLAK